MPEMNNLTNEEIKVILDAYKYYKTYSSASRVSGFNLTIVKQVIDNDIKAREYKKIDSTELKLVNFEKNKKILNYKEALNNFIKEYKIGM